MRGLSRMVRMYQVGVVPLHAKEVTFVPLKGKTHLAKFSWHSPVPRPADKHTR
jgi:hypothetical protein